MQPKGHLSETTAQRFYSVIEEIKDYAILMLGPDGRMVTWNVGVERLFGYREPELIGRHFSLLFTTEDRERGIPQTELETARATGRTLDNRWLLRSDNTVFWAEGATAVFTDASGAVDGFCKIVQDATRRKQVEEDLRSRLTQLESVYDTANAASRASALEDVYEAALTGLERALNVDRTAILLYDSDGVIKFKASRGLSRGFMEAVEGRSPWPAGASEASPILVPDARRSRQAQEDPLWRLAIEEGLQSVAFIPVWGQTRLVGKLMLYHNQPRNFTEQEIRLAETVTSHIGFAAERKWAEERTIASLAEKESLLREIHHRVKNHLQIIASLVNLQAGQISDPIARRAYEELRDRVRAMALIYSTVTQSGSIVSVHFADYIRKLIDQIIRSGEDRKGTITATLDLDPVAFGIDTATPCGLIVNELVTNALQHTFPLIGGEVRVQLRGVGDGTYQLAVIDNGVGFPSPQDWQVPRCLGLQLVATLVEQLDGVLESATNGDQTSVTIRFREVRYQKRY